MPNADVPQQCVTNLLGEDLSYGMFQTVSAYEQQLFSEETIIPRSNKKWGVTHLLLEGHNKLCVCLFHGLLWWLDAHRECNFRRSHV